MKDKLRIIVTGLIGLHYTMGGVTWDYIQYVLGFKNLGHDVFYFEDSGEWPYNMNGGPSGDKWESENCDANIDHISRSLRRYGLEKKWAYKYPVANTWYGLNEKKRNEVLNSADLLINVSGSLVHPENYKTVKRLVYLDSDPGFTEIKLHSSIEFSHRVLSHDVHFSFGELLSDRKVNSGIKWNATRSPIVLSEWESINNPRNLYTTIMNWTSYEPLKWKGKIYSQKDMEFIQFLNLPKRIPSCHFEVAMPKLHHNNWNSTTENVVKNNHLNNPRDLLVHYGWQVVNSQQVCGNMNDYRSFIESSKGEWSVAKGGYVVDNSGWFSCRSGCYLAAGKPVVVQNTGFDEILPTGAGLFAFNNMEEAIDALQQVEANYSYHSRKAKEIASEYLDANIVLKDLLDKSLS